MFEALGILLTHYAWLALWLGTAGLAGLALQAVLLELDTGDQSWPNAELAVFFSIGAGFAMQILVLTMLAAVQQLNATSVIAAGIALSGCSVWLLWLRPQAVGALIRVLRRPWQEWLAILPVVLVIAAWLVRPLGPAAGSDPLTYHLPYARFYLEQGGLAVNDTLRFPLHAHNMNLLYAAALLRPYTVESPAMAQMLHAGMGWLSLLGIYGMARHLSGWATAIFAVLAVLLLDEFVFSFSAAFVDNGAMLFVTGAFLAVAQWQGGSGTEARKNGWLWLAAILAGSAMGTKYVGAWFTLPLGLWVLWQSRSPGLAIRFALLVSATGMFWYARSWWLVGNPVHPFAGELFGYTIWNADDLQGQMRELASHGLPKTWQNLLLLPWRMFTDWHRFNGSVGNAGLLVGLFMASCLLLRWQRPYLRPIHLACLAYLIFWFFSSQVVRYLMIILPLMSLCTMVLWAGVLRRWHHDSIARAKTNVLNVTGRRMSTILLACTVTGLMLLGGARGYRDLIRVPLTAEKQQQFLAEWQPAYAPALAALAHDRIGDGPILQFNLQEIRWFFPGTVYGDWMGRYPWRNFGHIGDSGHWEMNAAETLRQQMEDIGAVAMVYAQQPELQFSPQPLDSYLGQFEIRYVDDRAVLLAPRELRLIAQPEL